MQGNHTQIIKQPSGIHPSLLDIAFVLVFMFLILSTLAVTTQKEAEEKTLPPLQLTDMEPDGAEGGTREQSVIISIQEGPTFYLDETPLALSDLEKRLAALRPPRVEIRGDVHIPYGAVTEILRICQENGIDNVALTYKAQARP